MDDDALLEAGSASEPAELLGPSCHAWCWIGVGALALLCFAPFGLAAKRYLPPKVSAHGAMVLAQIIFGAGTVLVGGDMKAHPIDPVVFALVREAMAALALASFPLNTCRATAPSRKMSNSPPFLVEQSAGLGRTGYWRGVTGAHAAESLRTHFQH